MVAVRSDAAPLNGEPDGWSEAVAGYAGVSNSSSKSLRWEHDLSYEAVEAVAESLSE